jgi:hypothetical protein
MARDRIDGAAGQLRWDTISRALIARALLFTVDSNVGDFRQSVEKMKGTTGSAEPGRRMGPFTDHSHSPHDASLNWKDVEWLKSVAGDVPVYLKGVSSVEVSVQSTPCFSISAGRT